MSKNVCTKAGGDCYWHRLPDNEKHKFLSIWKLTLQEAENIIPKPPNKKAKFEITKELAKFDKNRLVQQGIEPNPGPHHTRRKSVPKPIIPGAWRALEAWSNTVLLLQDTPFSSEELKSFSRAARARNYRTYHVASSKVSGRPNGGVVALVPTHLRQQPLHTTDGNIQICVIDGCTIINSYAFPGEQAKHAETIFLNMQQLGLEQTTWLIAGDRNETPEESCLCNLISPDQPGCIKASGQSTRWEGQREIDWFMTNKPSPFSDAFLGSTEHISDHIDVNTWMIPTSQPAQAFRFRPQPKWSPPTFISEEVWKKTLAKTWDKLQNLPELFTYWWRCWAGAWAHCISMKHYAKALPPFVSGIHQHLRTEESATILQDAFVNKNVFLFSLDYKQAFDRMNANSSSSFLQKIDFPTSITSLIQQVWNTQRTVQYGQSLSRKVLQSNCTPQGCPLAPITLVSWMVSGHFFVTGIYMDDRSVVDSDLHRSIDRVDTWPEWSSRVQLRESLDKIQQRQQAILHHEKPEWTQHSEVKVLGITITNKRRQNSKTEKQRLDRALSRTNLIAALPLSQQTLFAAYQALVVSVAAYGWTHRRPTKQSSDSLPNALTKALKTNKVANSNIRKVVYAATTYLDCVALQRLVRRTCRLRLHNHLRWNNKAFTSVHLLRTLMKAHGWTEQAPWHWTNGRGNNRLVTSPSNERKLICNYFVTKLVNSGDAIVWMPGPVGQDMKLLGGGNHQQNLSGKPKLMVRTLLGSVVPFTPAQPVNVQFCLGLQCHLAGFTEARVFFFVSLVLLQLGHVEHLFWQCPGWPRRPMTPSSFLQQRFGWPPASQPSNIAHQILHHIREVIAGLWNQRRNLEVQCICTRAGWGSHFTMWDNKATSTWDILN